MTSKYLPAICALFLLFTSVVAGAAAPIIPPPPTINATSYLLIDADSQEVIVDKSSSERSVICKTKLSPQAKVSNEKAGFKLSGNS